MACEGIARHVDADKAPGEAITLAFCWVHLRRHFFDIAKGGVAPIASEALERIAAIYAIEKTIHGSSADERRAVRQERSRPLVVALKAWLEPRPAHVRAAPTRVLQSRALTAAFSAPAGLPKHVLPAV